MAPLSLFYEITSLFPHPSSMCCDAYMRKYMRRYLVMCKNINTWRNKWNKSSSSSLKTISRLFFSPFFHILGIKYEHRTSWVRASGVTRPHIYLEKEQISGFQPSWGSVAQRGLHNVWWQHSFLSRDTSLRKQGPLMMRTHPPAAIHTEQGWAPQVACSDSLESSVAFIRVYDSETRPDIFSGPKWFGNKNMLYCKPT